MLFLLNQPNSALQTELDQFFHALQRTPHERRVVSAQAFSKARQKLKASALLALNDLLQAQLDALNLRQTWRGLRLLAIDGSQAHLPLMPAMETHFGTHCTLPTARLSMLYDVLDQQTLHGLIITPETDERGCVLFHLDRAPPNGLILFDRGYPAHWLFAVLQQRQQPFLMRLSPQHNRVVKDFVASGQAEAHVSFACRDSHAREVCRQFQVDPDSVIPLRLIRITLPDGTVEVLATSLRDTNTFPVAEFADLYARRWGIETDYRRLKQTLNLEGFSGRTVVAVYQDVQARILLKNLALLTQTLQQPTIALHTAARKWRYQANFTQGVSRLKNTLVRLMLTPCLEAWAQLLALIRGSLSVVRPKRRYPRKRRRQATQGCEGYKRTR